MKSTNNFRSIEVDPNSPNGVSFCNPFPYKYERSATGKELIKIWNEESRLREKELDEFHKSIHSRP